MWILLALVLALVWRRPALLALVVAADLIAEVTADVLKRLIPRQRPQHADALVVLPHTHSFPSGHATTSFACATVLAVAEPRLRIPVIVLAAAIAFSRLYNGVHWPLDVLAGAALGVAIGLLVPRALRLPAISRRGSRRVRRRG